MPRFRAAIIGLGAMGRNHARVLSQRTDIDLIAVADVRDPSNFVGLVDPAVTIVRDVDQVLRHDPDLAVVAVPSYQHAAVACKLARAGIATLIEKPLAPSSSDALGIIEEFDRTGTLGMVGHIERYNPALQELKRRLDLGEIGEPLHLSTVRHGPHPNRIRDVGVVLDLATHDLDIGRWLLGCEYATPTARVLSLNSGSAEDLVSVLDQSPSGAVVTHSVNWISTHKERRVTVLGTTGLMRADLLTADLVREEHPTQGAEWDQLARLTGPSVGELIAYAFPKPEPLAAEIEVFVAAATGIQVGMVSLDDGLRAVSAAERVLMASCTHRDRGSLSG